MKSDPLYLNCSLCADHFEDCEFMNAKTKSKLKWNTVPTLFSTHHNVIIRQDRTEVGVKLFRYRPSQIRRAFFRVENKVNYSNKIQYFFIVLGDQ